MYTMKLINTVLFYFILTSLFILQLPAQNHFQTFEKDPLKVKQVVLRNGLTVMLSENHQLPKVFGMVVVNAGSKNDPVDATGIAHYLEHMLFKGTKKIGTIDYEKEKIYLEKINELYDELGKTQDESARKEIQKQINEQSVLAGEYAIPNELDKMLAQIGSTGVNAFTTNDYTAYINSFPSNQIESWLEIYSKRFNEPVFRLFQSELESVYEEKNRQNDNVFAMVYEKFFSSFYKQHPYGQQTVLGSKEHLKNPSLRKMYEFFNSYYVANNMAIILSGDFNSYDLLPILEEKFGSWPEGEIKKYPKFKEEPFNGRELVEVNLTPIKAAIMGYRTPPNVHKDLAALKVINNILSNPEQTGLLDKLSIDGELMMAGINTETYNDHGATMIYFIPKLLGQTIEEGENLIKSKLEFIKNGEITDEMLNSVKLNIIKNISKNWENNESRALEMANSFVQKNNWSDYIKLENEIKLITKNDIVKAAQNYYGDNYLMFVSKMGFPKKENLNKPNFDPIVSKNEVKSDFYKSIETISKVECTPKFVDFNKDLKSKEIKPGVRLNKVYNPFNNVFSAEIKFGIGYFQLPILKYTADYLNVIGTDSFSSVELKKSLYELGCSYYFDVNGSELILNLEGPDESLSAALSIINELILKPKLDQEKVSKIKDDLKAIQKLERDDPSSISGALQEFVLFGSDSKKLKELNRKELKKLKASDLLYAFDQAKRHQITINYAGKKSLEDVIEAFKSNLEFSDSLTLHSGVNERSRILGSENIIYVLNKKNAIQCQINFNIEGKPLNNSDIAKIDAFNEYFGNNMSSLVFQEIREFRSLAYSTSAFFRKPKESGYNSLFNGFIGCQADKTNEAIDAMVNLIRNMPEKPERMEMIKASLIQSSQTDKPDFRLIASKIQEWQKLGYKQDPNSLNLPLYKSLKFEDIKSTYEEVLKDKPLTITIVGNTKKIDFKKLSNYGKVVIVKQKQLYNN